MSKQTKKLEKLSILNQNDSFHESIGFVLTIGQCFAQIPIVGVLDKNYRNARFEMYSFRTYFAIFFMVLGILETYLSLKRTFGRSLSMASMQAPIFIVVCLAISVLLFGLARKWHLLIRYWQERENCFLLPQYKINGMRMKTKINLVSITFLIFSLIEHLLYFTSAMTLDYKQFTTCGIKNIDFVNFFFIKERPHIFLVIPFHYSLIVPSIWQNLTMTFCWNYVNLIIIGVSIGLTTRFEQINDRLQSAIETNVDDTFWREIRGHYVNVVDILQMVDEELALIIILTSASNLYFICLQLFNSFTPIPFFMSKIYFWYSLIFVICRTLCVLLFAASLHDASRKSVGFLRNIPTKMWTNEVQRFLDLITSECFALSGKKFFYLTKNVILAMAGTVVTYELVLLDQVEEEAERKSICNLTRFNFTKN